MRKLITICAVLLGIAIAYAFVKYASQPPVNTDKTAKVAQNDDSSSKADNQTTKKTDTGNTQPQTPQPDKTPPVVVENKPVQPVVTPQPITNWTVQDVEKQPEPVIGGLAADGKPAEFMVEAKFTPWGAGLASLHLSKYSTVVQKMIPYPIQEKLPNGNSYRYPFAIEYLRINGQPVAVMNKRWQVVADQTNRSQATFQIVIVDAEGKPALRVTRTYKIPDKKRYDISVSQKVENLSTQALRVEIIQNGPGDMPLDKSANMDRREVAIGYYDLDRNEGQRIEVENAELHQLRAAAIDGDTTLWPTEETTEAKLEYVWAAMTSRYFAVAMHSGLTPPNKEGRQIAQPSKAYYSQVDRLKFGIPGAEKLLLSFVSHPLNLTPAGGEKSALNLNFEVFAGPKERQLLRHDKTYEILGFGRLIIYDLGSMCSFCTFEFLAELLIGFLIFIAGLANDWGIAIIGLVIVVRGLLHPLTKRSQINMMKVSKQMQMIQPDIERIKKKYGDDQKRMNTEMMRMYKEKGVNPAAMGLGCLPMFLQMPIWIALYAMLYFAIELRHEPAFWGVFQTIGDWGFLADLSSPDQFMTFDEGGLFGISFLRSFNILPILLAAVFFLQQKYMSTPAATPEAAKQQNMMKYMMLLFPIFLYNMPSGLNLYIITSSMIGIVESKRVRAHIAEEEANGTLFLKKEKKGGCLGGGMMQKLAEAAEQQQKKLEQSKGQPQGGGGGQQPRGGRGSTKGPRGGKRKR